MRSNLDNEDVSSMNLKTKVNDNLVDISTSITPENDGIAFEAELVQTATDSHPLRIRLSAVNAADAPRQMVFGFTPPFSRYVLERTSGDGALVLIPENYFGQTDSKYVPTEPRDGCWRATGAPDVLDTGTYTTVDPDGRVESEYVLLDYPDNSTCFPPGCYSASEAISVGNSDSEYRIECVVDVREDGEPP